MAEADGNFDQLAEEAVEKVRLDRFTADPDQIGPFEMSTLTWQVALPEVGDVSVSVVLDGVIVDPSGELGVSPPITTTYHLVARAGRHSKILGQLTLSVDLHACSVKTIDRIANLVAGKIRDDVQARTDGIYLGATWPSPNPIVTVTEDTMHVQLVLGKNISNFPDPTITIDLNFRVAIVPANVPSYGHVPGASVISSVHPVVGAVDKDVRGKVEFPWWAWGIPGAFVGLAIAIDNAEGEARREGGKMADAIAASLDTLFPTPNHTRKQRARFYVGSASEDGLFEITYCPPAPASKPQ